MHNKAKRQDLIVSVPLIIKVILVVCICYYIFPAILTTCFFFVSKSLKIDVHAIPTNFSLVFELFLELVIYFSTFRYAYSLIKPILSKLKGWFSFRANNDAIANGIYGFCISSLLVLSLNIFCRNYS
jgi:hypothetical protein